MPTAEASSRYSWERWPGSERPTRCSPRPAGVSSRGEDIVIGLIETHGRPATAELLEGFEQIPLKKIEYRGATFYELDTAAVIKRVTPSGS